MSRLPEKTRLEAASYHLYTLESVDTLASMTSTGLWALKKSGRVTSEIVDEPPTTTTDQKHKSSSVERIHQSLPR